MNLGVLWESDAVASLLKLGIRYLQLNYGCFEDGREMLMVGSPWYETPCRLLSATANRASPDLQLLAFWF